MTTMALLTVLFTLAAFSVFPTEGSFLRTQVIHTTSGPLRGQKVNLPNNKIVYRYLGIPYCTARRFEPCEEQKWSEVYEASKDGKACPQPVSNSYGVSKQEESSEDCLNLNIFTANSTTDRLPVMVFLQDVFYSFSNARKAINGVDVASRGRVVVITFNYRLGLLGYLQVKSKTNLGLRDKISALTWIVNNIASFGGNPHDVTLIGHSTAAMAVGLLLISPQAQGLFQRAIMMSGSPLSPLATIDQSTAEFHSRLIGQYFNCKNLSAIDECLAPKPVSDIILAQQALNNTPILSPFAPVIDNDIIPDSPAKLFKFDKLKVNSIIIGVQEDDGQIFRTELPGILKKPFAPLQTNVNELTFTNIVKESKWSNKYPVDIHVLSYQYTDWTNRQDNSARSEKLNQLYSDSAFNSPAVRLADIIANRSIPTFFYYMTKRAFNKTASGVQHYDGVRALFDQRSSDGDVMERAFEKWMSFVKTGNPSHPNNVATTWPTYTPNGNYIAIATNITIQSKFLSDRMAFWNNLLPSMTPPLFETTPTPTVMQMTTGSHDNDAQCEKKKDTTKALTAVVAVMAIVIIIMLSIIIYQARILSKRQDANSNTS